MTPLIIQITRTSDRPGQPGRIVAQPCYVAADGPSSRTMSEPMSISTAEHHAEATLIERVAALYGVKRLRIVPSRQRLVEKFESTRAVDAIFQGKISRDADSITVPLTGYAGPAAITVRRDRMVLLTPILAWLAKRSTDDVVRDTLSFRAGSLCPQWIDRPTIDLPDPGLSDLAAQQLINASFRERINQTLDNSLITGINDPLFKAEPVVQSGSLQYLIDHTRALLTVITPDGLNPVAMLYVASETWQDGNLVIEDCLDKRRMTAAHAIFDLIQDRNRMVAPVIRFDDIGSPARLKSYRRVQNTINVGYDDGMPTAHERLAAASLLTDAYGEAFTRIHDGL